jgi:hypothetical protein
MATTSASAVWFWKPQWYWFGWRTLIPFSRGGDEWDWHTFVLGWTITGRVIIATHRCRGTGKCAEDFREVGLVDWPATCKCGRKCPTRDAAYTCEDCLDRLSKALGDMAWVDTELAITIGKERGLPTEGGPAGSEKSLPFHVAAAQVRDNLRNTLVGWVRVCAEEGVRSSDPRDGLPEDTLTAMSRWLLWRVDGLAFNEAGSEAVDEITYAVTQAVKAIDLAPERQYVGPCSCGRDLYRKPGAPKVKCRACATEYDAEVFLADMAARMADLDLLVTAVEGAGLLSRFKLETTARVIYGWEERKLIAAHGERQEGRKMRKVYRFDELMRLAAQRATRLTA